MLFLYRLMLILALLASSITVCFASCFVWLFWHVLSGKKSIDMIHGLILISKEKRIP